MRTEPILTIETTVDDTQPQVVAYVLERALALGALDAYATAAQMKKQRPGVVVTLLARPEQRAALVELLLRETSTLGVRILSGERVVLERELVAVETAFGRIRVKVARLEAAAAGGGCDSKAAPEYEDCRAAALRHGVPLRRVLAAALGALGEAGAGGPARRS